MKKYLNHKIEIILEQSENQKTLNSAKMCSSQEKFDIANSYHFVLFLGPNSGLEPQFWPKLIQTNTQT